MLSEDNAAVNKSPNPLKGLAKLGDSLTTSIKNNTNSPTNNPTIIDDNDEITVTCLSDKPFPFFKLGDSFFFLNHNIIHHLFFWRIYLEL